jgi:hypothetical protein
LLYEIRIRLFPEVHNIDLLTGRQDEIENEIENEDEKNE